MNAAVKILAGATPVRAPDPPAPVFLPVPAPELAHDFYDPDREGVLVCAKAQQSGCTSAGMAQRHWWASKKQCAVCCQCREDYGMTTGSPQTLRTIRQAVDAPLEVSDENLTSFLCALKRQHVFLSGILHLRRGFPGPHSPPTCRQHSRPSTSCIDGLQGLKLNGALFPRCRLENCAGGLLLPARRLAWRGHGGDIPTVSDAWRSNLHLALFP